MGLIVGLIVLLLGAVITILVIANKSGKGSGPERPGTTGSGYAKHASEGAPYTATYDPHKETGCCDGHDHSHASTPGTVYHNPLEPTMTSPVQVSPGTAQHTRKCPKCHGKKALGAFGPCSPDDFHFEELCRLCNATGKV